MLKTLYKITLKYILKSRSTPFHNIKIFHIFLENFSSQILKSFFSQRKVNVRERDQKLLPLISYLVGSR